MAKKSRSRVGPTAAESQALGRVTAKTGLKRAPRGFPNDPLSCLVSVQLSEQQRRDLGKVLGGGQPPREIRIFLKKLADIAGQIIN